MKPVNASVRPTPHSNRTARSRCPQCGQPLPAIPDSHVKVCAPTPIKQYALEHTFGVKRMNGGFV